MNGIKWLLVAVALFAFISVAYAAVCEDFEQTATTTADEDCKQFGIDNSIAGGCLWNPYELVVFRHGQCKSCLHYDTTKEDQTFDCAFISTRSEWSKEARKYVCENATSDCENLSCEYFDDITTTFTEISETLNNLSEKNKNLVMYSIDNNSSWALVKSFTENVDKITSAFFYVKSNGKPGNYLLQGIGGLIDACIGSALKTEMSAWFNGYVAETIIEAASQNANAATEVTEAVEEPTEPAGVEPTTPATTPPTTQPTTPTEELEVTGDFVVYFPELGKDDEDIYWAQDDETVVPVAKISKEIYDEYKNPSDDKNFRVWLWMTASKEGTEGTMPPYATLKPSASDIPCFRTVTTEIDTTGREFYEVKDKDSGKVIYIIIHKDNKSYVVRPGATGEIPDKLELKSGEANESGRFFARSIDVSKGKLTEDGYYTYEFKEGTMEVFTEGAVEGEFAYRYAVPVKAARDTEVPEGKQYYYRYCAAINDFATKEAGRIAYINDTDPHAENGVVLKVYSKGEKYVALSKECETCSTIAQCLACIDEKFMAELFGVEVKKKF